MMVLTELMHIKNTIDQLKNTGLNDGNIYIISQKAVGTDWKQKNILALRYATECAKFTD